MDLGATTRTHVPRRTRARRCSIFFALVATLGCASDVSSGPGTTTLSASGVADATLGTARANLGADGHFVSLEQNSATERSAQEAVAFANVYAQKYVGYIQSWLEETRGASINKKMLKACGRPFYAETTFQPISEAEPAGIRNGFGSYWLVTLCAGPEPQVSLAVSAKAGMTLVNGNIRFGDDAGGEFFAYGIPKGHVGEFPLSPEAAAATIARKMGAQIVTTPRLILPMHADGFPQNAKWEVELNRDVVLDSGPTGNRATRRLAIGAILSKGKTEFATYAASEEQPTKVVYRYLQRPKKVHPGERDASNSVEGVAYLRPNLTARYSYSEARDR